ncbi:phenylalanine--tRNA ligase subunit alpha [bacterium]|nr:phenylalanine--tRNA ligase subunit alpha [bacterium]
MALDIEALRAEAQDLIKAAKDMDCLSQIRIRYLGRKGELTSLIKNIGHLPQEERPKFGERLNQLKLALTREIDEKQEAIKKLSAKTGTGLDLTLPGIRPERGRKHPLTQILEETYHIFTGLGFKIAEGPEIETDYYNFGALNFPDDHPARDMHDSFYLGTDNLLRTHTSPVQIRVMKSQPPPVRIIAPGKVYRRDADITHTPMFHQVEGLLVDNDVSFSDLKGVLTSFVHQMFGPDKRLRFRPSFFPFTEPSAEIDISCVMCMGKGCRVCSQSGWLEILGAGMVHPNVLNEVGYDPEQVTGFAFGAGVERIAMLKYGVDDIRLFFENDIRFLRQF